jgi:hypothetical protein
MKKLLSIISLAALLGPAVALADEVAQNAPSSPHAAVFEQVHQKMAQIHNQARSQILASLTPAHKAALANIVGQLAIAPNPDVDGAARQIDTLLSTGEKQSIVRIHDQAKAQMRSVMEAAHQQMAASMPAGDHVVMQAPKEAQERGEGTSAAAPDAGRMLLHMLIPHGGMHHPD